MSARGIRCKECGRTNDLTAFACDRCGASLVGGGADRFLEARERDMTIEAQSREGERRSTGLRKTLVGAIGLVALVLVAWVGLGWYSKNYYIFGEPLYDKHPAAYWVEMLGSDDHYLRRRAAQALNSIGDRFNQRTATEVVPALRKALADEDDGVRVHARSALDKIQRATGVS